MFEPVEIIAVEYLEELDDEFIEFSFSAKESQCSIAVERATYEIDNGIIQNGMDSYCVCTAAASVYGALSEVELSGEGVVMYFREGDYELLGVPQQLRLSFAKGIRLSNEDRSHLRNILTWGRFDKMPSIVET